MQAHKEEVIKVVSLVKIAENLPNVSCPLNPCPAEYIKMPHPFLVFSQSNYLIQIVDINLHT